MPPALPFSMFAPGPAPGPTNPPLPTPTIDLDACEPDTLCRMVYDTTGHKWMGAFAEWLVAKPTKVLAIVIITFAVRALFHRATTRLARRAGNGTAAGVLGRRLTLFEATNPLVTERRRQRAETMGSVLNSLATGVLFSVAFAMILAEFGFNLAPIIASAGIFGLALGFGAQSLVRDFISGIFMILEDQYGVGDVIDLGAAVGTVEAVGLRVTRIRDVRGTVWYVRNGEIERVGNMSQGWNRALVDVAIAYDENVDRVRQVLKDTAEALWHDPEWAGLVVEEPAVWGVEAVSSESVVLRVAVKTAPLKKDDVARELRRRIKDRLAAEGIATAPAVATAP